MRILFALVVMHCFGCVIPKDSDYDLMHQRPICDHRTMAENSNNQIPSKGCPAVGSADADADDRRERYNLEAMENQTTDNDKQASFMDIRAAGHKLSRSPHTSGFLQIQKAEFIHLPSGRSASIDRRRNVNQLVSWHHRRRGAPLQRQRSARDKWRTPLPSYLRHIPVKRRVKPTYRTRHLNGDHRSYREFTETERKNSEAGDGERVAHEEDSEGDDDYTAEAAENTEIEAGEWDEWTEWSECSASCGCGRQVRWRHCAGRRCMNGLKKAQIRTCHLRDCNNKNFLSWLGVKA